MNMHPILSLEGREQVVCGRPQEFGKQDLESVIKKSKGSGIQDWRVKD